MTVWSFWMVMPLAWLSFQPRFSLLPRAGECFYGGFVYHVRRQRRLGVRHNPAGQVSRLFSPLSGLTRAGILLALRGEVSCFSLPRRDGRGPR